MNNNKDNNELNHECDISNADVSNDIDNEEDNVNDTQNNAQASTNNEDSNNSSNESTNTSKSQLIQQLQTLNLSIGTIYVILIAIFLNLEYVYGERLKLLDQLNGTKYSENQSDKGDNPEISNRMFLYATAIFLLINWKNLQQVLATDDNSETGLKNKRKAYNSFLASLLIFIATLINRNNFTF
ncbi:UNVERIFIED_ORG: hypothetical protein B2H98_11300 [Clostridium botulinum]|uniref:Uncharacterized protein n=1 Tax=Clostridium botulinum TaxID=1491 RepID=A0A6B4R779_CLOBO|nr:MULTISPECIES: hypothetical protein [Clostridium]ACD52318.1 hypothetical protein CLH_2673 [Clostridium botulinum E3 str. Alaska E43]AJF30506.1 hypothetical protein ST13_12610 [Clostridium botulinum]AJF33569.1 hypothetical protein ST12_12610 [Clostridium botulinum]KIL07747.1 hypothetical protein SR42_01475 [Clostridium botulinum]MBN1049603.1 hypothetical protein [Clostridium botulinum]